MQKTIVIRHKSDCANVSFVPGTPSERMAFVWPLTLEVVSLSKKYDAEQRLQRHVTRFVRQKGLVVNKRASGRTKDLADAEMLEGK